MNGSNLGFFQSTLNGKISTERAENAWVLVVHYEFKGKECFRKGDEVDVKNLRRTFEGNRKCRFRDVSPDKEYLLQLLANDERLLALFDCQQIPSVFVIFFLSHGDADGIIYTDRCDRDGWINFTTDEIFQALKCLVGFDKCLKLVNFGPCRGDLDDPISSSDSRNSCRMTFYPEMHNLAVFYSTVETTTANRDLRFGSWFVRAFCDVLDSMEEDQLLLNVLTCVQKKIHKMCHRRSLASLKYEGQTPEAKLFSQDALFYFAKADAREEQLSSKDAIGNTENVEHVTDFYPWRSDAGRNLRGKKAFILYGGLKDETVNAMYKALHQNLNFDTSERKLNMKSLDSYVFDVSNFAEDVGCVLTCILGQLSEKDITKEVCVRVHCQEIPVTDLLHRLISPESKWTGKPKIFLFLDQAALEKDCHSLHNSTTEILATNHSGWLTLILKEKRLVAQLLEILNGDGLKEGKSLQELLSPLLVDETKANGVLLNSTLQYLLDFPDWPRSFVKPDFKLTSGRNAPDLDLTFDGLMRKVAKEFKESRIWLLSSIAGAGKTTVLNEIAFQLGKLEPNLKILRIALPKYRLFFLKSCRIDDLEFLNKATNYCSKEISEGMLSKKLVVFFDGFDEICPHYREKVLGLVRALKGRGLTMWIGTRPHEGKEIVKQIPEDIISISIESFDKLKQKEFLHLEMKQSEGECNRFLASFPKADVLKNPLHLSLLAECSGDDNLYKIYDSVVRKKVRMCLERENDNRPVSEEKVELELIPLRLIASRFVSGRRLVGPGVSPGHLERVNDLGIATFVDGQLTFLHQTFAEFLTAQQFLSDYRVFGRTELRLFDRYHWGVFEECRSFVDSFFGSDEDEREIVLKIALDTGPYTFLKRVCEDNLKNVFTALKPYISFLRESRALIRIRNGLDLLLRAFKNEEIAVGLVELGVVDSAKLEGSLQRLLDRIFNHNAIKLFEKLNERFHGALSRFIQKNRSVGKMKKQLFDAARNGHAGFLGILIAAGCDPNASQDNKNAIYASCKNGHLRCVEILLANHARVAECFGKRQDPLVVASAHGHLDIVEFLLEQDSGVRDKETFEMEGLRENWNAFHYAVAKGHSEIAQCLLSRNKNLIETKEKEGHSPLQLAATKNNLEMCRWLVERGADPGTLLLGANLVFKDHFLMLSGGLDKDERGKTTLQCAAQYNQEDLVREAVARGADLEAKDHNGWNAVHFACVNNKTNAHSTSIRIIQLLLEHNANLAGQRTNHGETALHIYLKTHEKCVIEFVRFLVEHVRVDYEAVDDQGRTALSLVSGRQCCRLLTPYFESVRKSGSARLLSAAKNGDLNSLQECIESGADLDLEGEDGATALHLAADGGHSGCVKRLVHAGANLEALWRSGKVSKSRLRDSSEDLEGPFLKSHLKGACGPTALLLAAEKGHSKIVQWLVAAGANPEARDQYGRTALMLACRFNRVEVVKFLLDENVELRKTDKRGRNAMHHALWNAEINRLLHARDETLVKAASGEQGRSVLHLAAIHNAIEVVPWLLSHARSDLLDATDKNGGTPLNYACKRNASETAERLLDAGADAEKPDRDRKSPIVYAAKWENVDLMQKLLDKGARLRCGKKNVLRKSLFNLEMLKRLHERNPDLVKEVDQNGNNLLHVAIRKHKSSFQIARWLITELKIDLEARNKAGETALLLACQWGRWDVVDLLINNNVDLAVTNNEGKSALDFSASWEFCSS